VLNIKVWMTLFLGVFSLMACSDSGTVDPNALASTGLSVESAESSSSAFVVSSSSVFEKLSASANGNVHEVVSKVTDTLIAVLDWDDGAIGFKTSVTGQCSYDNYIVAEYRLEQGATATCGDSTKSYLAKVRLDSGNVVEKSITLQNFGAACRLVRNAFLNSCFAENYSYSDTIVCDEHGNLNVYCSVKDKKVDYAKLVESLKSASEAACRDIGNVTLTDGLRKN